MSKPASTALEVWLDCNLAPACLVGTLAHDRGQIRFRYERSWLNDRRAFALDPDLTLDDAPFFPKPELGNFGIFLDSAPDRWGQTLINLKTAVGHVRMGRHGDVLGRRDNAAGYCPQGGATPPARPRAAQSGV